MKKLLLSGLTLAFAFNLSAQDNRNTSPVPAAPIQTYTLGHRTCGTHVPPKEWDEAFNKQVELYKEKLASGRTTTNSYTIPVIIHIIHGGQAVGTYPNLSNSQLVSQIPILNADFAGTGLNVGNLAATAFSAVGAANCGVRFCLATNDTDGVALPEAGIDRISYVARGWASPTSFNSTSSFENYINTVVKPGSIWDPSSFLNIWITDTDVNNTGILGFATFPAGALLSGLPGNSLGGPTTDGVWVWCQCWGNVGSLTPGYDKGRTATHEIGHYLGLRHIGGDGNGNVAGDCTATDYCNDTPPQKGGNAGGQYGQNYGNPSYPLHAASCGTAASPNGNPNGDMFMNFMDYSDDVALNMFTPNQATRIQIAMQSGTYRAGLSASSATQCAGAPVANITMTNVTCPAIENPITNNTTGGPAPSYTWTSSPAGVSFSPSNNSSNPTVNFPGAGTYTISAAISNPSGNTSYSNVVTVNACTGIQTNAIFASYISIQPNPSSGKLNIVTNLPGSQTVDVMIMNSLGQVLLNGSYKGIANSVIPVDLSAQPSGVYFVSISNGQERVVKRIVLSK